MDDGSEIPYNKVCIAAGSSPFVPPFKGLDTVPEKYSFMTLDDAEALKNALSPDSRVLIVGAGLIGLKCAEGIRRLVKEITVCDLADRVLSSILDHDCAAMMQKHLEEGAGVISVYYGAEVQEDQAQVLADALAKANPSCDVELHNGGQPVYYYIVSVE